ncbi:DUF2599 domain-containing protein [Paenibacillus lautus]|uniref:DUF2599 domain-containing protein n=1 Tax=Paenibacillus lautus TaxID=1401 RepID=UPI001C3FD5BB|nr:DUF2599 domain-containing protein [Paenibacillus lautus]
MKSSKSLSLVLGVALLLNFGHVISAEGMNTSLTDGVSAPLTQLTTEEGKTFGVGEPKVKNESAKSIKLNKTMKQNEVEQSISFIPSADDTSIEIPFEFTNGEYLELNKDNEPALNLEGVNIEKSATGIAGNIYNKDGRSIGVFSATLIGDEEGESLLADTTGDILKLQANANNINAPIEIQIRATSTYYSTYFSSFQWINRGGPYPLSLSLTHTNYIYEARTTPEEEARMFDSWDKLYAVHSSSTNWSNTQGMKDQYMCHVQFAESKNPWNLEPARPDVGFWNTVTAACNPEH